MTDYMVRIYYIYIYTYIYVYMLPWGSDGKASAYSVGDLGSIFGWEDPWEEGMATHYRGA